jgi:hypothetical protein
VAENQRQRKIVLAAAAVQVEALLIVSTVLLIR